MVTEATEFTETAPPAAEAVEPGSTPQLAPPEAALPAPDQTATAPPTGVVPPAATAPAAPTLPEQPPVAPEVQQYIDQLQAQAATTQRQADLGILDQTVRQYAQQLEQQQGLTPEQALFIAQDRGQLLYRQYQAEQMRRGQINAAFAMAKQYGVDPRSLMDLPSPQAMREAAENAGAASKRDQEVAALRAEVAALKRGAVPAQTFETGIVGAGAGNVAGEALEAAWLKFDMEHPADQPNPYTARYRAMLAAMR